MITATLDPPGRPRRLRAEQTSDLASIVDDLRSGHLAAVAIDMPIGLLDDRPRQADREARRLLGPRRSSVFPTPVRATLAAVDYTDACDRSRQACGRALSKQAFNLLPKIRDLDETVMPDDQDRLVEAHPELAFARLNDGPLEMSKHRAAGRQLRRQLLARELTAGDLAAVLDSGVAPLADLLDAAALVTTAARVADGAEVRLGTEVDSTGKRAEVVY